MRALLGVAATALLRRSASLYDEGGRIEYARLYGNVNMYAYYFVDLLVGSPHPQLTTVIVDTGSGIVGFPCQGCGHCGNHIDPPFDVRQSDTLMWFNCSEELCSTGCTQGPEHEHCSYKESYTEGSAISGYWFLDMVQLGDVADRNPPVLGEMGCHRDENKLFYTQAANGIMGMAPERSGPPTILQRLFADNRHVNKNVFSMCISEWGGLLSVGGYNSSIHKSGAEIQWIPMEAFGYYIIQPTRLSLDVGASNVTLGEGGAAFGAGIVDSGTTYTYLPGDLYARVKRELEAYCAAAGDPCGASREGTQCWQLADAAAGPAQFPAMSWDFGPHTRIRWDPRAYLYRTGGAAGRWCDAFADNGGDHSTVLGISWMMFRDVVFDLDDADNTRVGVAEADCPQYTRTDNIQTSQADYKTVGRSAAVSFGGTFSVFYFVVAGLLFVFAFACHLRRHQQRTRYEDVSQSSSVEGTVVAPRDAVAPAERSLLSAA